MSSRSYRGPSRRPSVILGSVAAGAAASFFVPGTPVTRGLAGWDVAIAIFMLSIGAAIYRTGLAALKERAEDYDGGRFLILLVTIAAVSISFGAIVFELSGGGLIQPNGGWLAAFTILTIVLSWALVHLMFALHYAHEYYVPEEGVPAQGLQFPGHDEPLYGDFIYFSYTIGVAAQTADVAITSPDLRRIVTVHAIVAFVFNTAIIALLINIGASLLSSH